MLNFNTYKQLWILAVSVFAITSCASIHSHRSQQKESIYQKNNNKIKKLRTQQKHDPNKKINKILEEAQRYLGSPYKFGGNTFSGIDCSGLVSTVFLKNGIHLHRKSSDQARNGKFIDINKVTPGDLLFFDTSGKNKVNHVGIVYTIESNGIIRFIHSSTSKGVIISSLEENYWNRSFLFARRILIN